METAAGGSGRRREGYPHRELDGEGKKARERRGRETDA